MIQSRSSLSFRPFQCMGFGEKYADRKSAPALRPLIWVDSKEVNYQVYLYFMNYWTSRAFPSKS